MNLHIDVGDTFDLMADSPEEAEATVKERVERCEIDIASLEVLKVEVEAYEHRDI